MTKVTIDGKAVEVPDKTTVFEAVRSIGNTLPHYCYHPGIGIEGSCRVCQVEVQGPGKMPRRLAISCRTMCEEGMLVFTASESADQARRMVLEFLLKNHPLDCPICDKAGECTLQNFAFDAGQGRSRSHEERRALRKRVDLGDVILFDEERCILCTRCVRFQGTVLGDPQLGVVQRGPNDVIATMPTIEGGDTPLHGNYQGVLADICPVGALTLKKFRFQARAWQLTAVPSVCSFCSRGCDTHVETFRGEVKRIRPRFNANANGYWMCDVGRFAYDDTNDRAGRLSVPLQRRDGEFAETSYAVGVGEAGKWLKANAGEGMLVIASPFLTNEEGKALLDLAKTVGAKPRVVLPEIGPSDELLHTGDPCPNRKGLVDLGFEPLIPGAASALREGSAPAKACLLAGEWIVDLLEMGGNAAAFLDDPKFPTIVVERRRVDRAGVHMCLPAANAFEKSGTFTNSKGAPQALRAAVSLPPGAIPDRDLLERLKAAVLESGHGSKQKSAAESAAAGGSHG
jgi:NADH-quinone oxidoreductase subunit G